MIEQCHPLHRGERIQLQVFYLSSVDARFLGLGLRGGCDSRNSAGHFPGKSERGLGLRTRWAKTVIRGRRKRGTTVQGLWVNALSYWISGWAVMELEGGMKKLDRTN